MPDLKYSNPLPIFRAFKSEGKRYLYGYACLFQVPDDFGTLMTRKVIEASEQRLRKFPAVHFNHKTSLGQIVWDQEVNGVSTHIDSVGFHVLVGVYDQCDKEWGMIQSGNWGFSYGFMPTKDGMGQKCIGVGEAKKCYKAFTKGFVYEVSVVDAPAHMDSAVHLLKKIERSLSRETLNDSKIPKGFGGGFLAMVDASLEGQQEPLNDPILRNFKGEGFIAMLESAFPLKPKAQPVIIDRKFPLNIAEEFPKSEFPATCSEFCTHIQCPYRREENFGRPCLHRWSNYENEGWWQKYKLKIAPSNPNEQLLR